MDILWGAWAKEVTYGDDLLVRDIKGIYNTIWKKAKSDFPFSADLHVILVYQASRVEWNRAFKITLEIIDQDAITRIFATDVNIIVPQGDMPLRWYEDYEFKNVIIEQPGYYELNISIERQYNQHVPLWIEAPKKQIISGDGREISPYLWSEDLEQWKKENWEI